MAEILDRQFDHDLVRPNPRSETTTLRAGERIVETALHRVIVGGGGAAGLELVTRLGDSRTRPI
jgi:NADH dehydrogenase